MWIDRNVGLLGLLSGQAVFDRVTWGWRLWLESFSFKVLIKVVSDFLIKGVNFSEKEHHLSVKVRYSFLKGFYLLFHELHSIIYFLDLFPINIFDGLPFLLTNRIHLSDDLIGKLGIFMMLLQIIMLKKDVFADLNKLFLDKKFLSFDEFIQETVVDQCTQHPLEYCTCVGVEGLKRGDYLLFELHKLFNTPDLIFYRLQVLFAPQAL